jgi:hypothetical protein
MDLLDYSTMVAVSLPLVLAGLAFYALRHFPHVRTSMTVGRLGFSLEARRPNERDDDRPADDQQRGTSEGEDEEAGDDTKAVATNSEP